jgi:hypothetical protein
MTRRCWQAAAITVLASSSVRAQAAASTTERAIAVRGGRPIWRCSGGRIVVRRI